MKKIAFFFGAGAEGPGNFNIKMGYEYLKSSLYASDYLSGFSEGLSEFFENKQFFNKGFSYRRDTLDVSTFVLKNFIIQKSLKDKTFFDNNNNIIPKILFDEDLRHICETWNRKEIPKHQTTPNERVNNIKTEFKKILTGELKKYSDIKDTLFKELFENNGGNIRFDLNIGIAGSLDSYFHTIIDPCKYSAIRFSKIFNYYWACYFTILHDVLKFLTQNGHECLNKYLKDSHELNYSAVLENIELLTTKLYKLEIKTIDPKESYYRLIREKIDKHKDELICQGVVTTNYYRFCEIVHEEPIYLNGQLKYFEFPELLEVFDVTKEKIHRDKLLFPFIFGQSLVKPIVNSVQTEAFHRFNTLLNELDVLVVLGFNINEDDNHINSFLHDFVNRGRRLIVVTKNDVEIIKRKLKSFNGNIKCISFAEDGDNNEVVKKIFEDILQNSA